MAGRGALLAAVLMLMAMPVAQRAQGPHEQIDRELFQTSDRCMACHNTLSTSAGEDISIGFAWRPTMMANSARDPYWQAGVRRESIDHPESQGAIEEECSKCHMPMANTQSRFEKREPEVFSHLDFGSEERIDKMAQDGVSCSLCHQIRPDNLGTRESFVGGFVIDTTRPLGERQEFGPFEVEKGENRIMRSSSGGYQPTEGKHLEQSELCATCHTLITTALGPNGQKIGELPEQMPYQEWFNSDFRDRQSCQSCHMPVVEEPVRMTSVLGKFREGVNRHVFVGGNFFVQRMLNRYRGELGVMALPAELEGAAARTIEHLQSKTARLVVDRLDMTGGVLNADISVENLGGHKFPTAYPSRRAWLHVKVLDRENRTIFESGGLNPNGSITGNDNDTAAGRFEPHYDEVSQADQVQIYEDIMVGQDGVPTTGLLTAVRFIKDNRLLPAGFQKEKVGQEIAPQGSAMTDDDFVAGGDRIRYAIPVANVQGPLRVDVELWFQPISYRWAANLRSYTAAEPQRFTRYYDAMSSGSAVLIDRASATVR
jgi:hypothetical protein